VRAQKPREIAFRVLLEHRDGAHFLEYLLERAFVKGSISPADRGLAQELAYGLVRWEKTLDWLIDQKTRERPEKPALQILLRLGLYQLFWLDRIPDHAAVHETVELAKHLGFKSQAGFINAVLRGSLRDREATRQKLAELRERDPAKGLSHPDWLYQRWRERWGEPDVRRLMEWNNQPPPTYARVNTIKTDAAQLAAGWKREGVQFRACVGTSSLSIPGSVSTTDTSQSSPSPLNGERAGVMGENTPNAPPVPQDLATPEGICAPVEQGNDLTTSKTCPLPPQPRDVTTPKVLPLPFLKGEGRGEGSSQAEHFTVAFELLDHPPLATLRSFQDGWFYIQDPSTLLAVHELDPQRGDTILDMCSAPGGKTTYIAALTGNESKLVATDLSPARLDMVRENCARLGVTSVDIEPWSAVLSQAATRQFDRILIDAPCSNTGVMRRRVELRWRVRPEELQRLATEQRDLLEHASQLLKPGGVLVYSTCSLEPEENTGATQAFLAAHPNFKLDRERTLLPFRDAVDGAYAARILRS